MSGKSTLAIEVGTVAGLHFLGLIATGQSALARGIGVEEPTVEGRVRMTYASEDMAIAAQRSLAEAAMGNAKLGLKTLVVGLEPPLGGQTGTSARPDARSLLSDLMKANLTPQEWATIAGAVFERAVFTSTSAQRALEREAERAQREGGQAT